MGSSEEDLSRMKTFCFSLLALLLLLPFASWSGKSIITSKDGHKFLLDTENKGSKTRAWHGLVNGDGEVNPASKRERSDNSFTASSCRGSGLNGARALHGAPCTTGENSRYAGRCCRGKCVRMRTWIWKGCKKPIKDDRRFFMPKG